MTNNPDISSAEAWEEYNRRKRQRATQRRGDATTSFSEVSLYARRNGLLLKRHDDVLYSLEPLGGGGWLINVYPGNRRLYSDKKRGKAPFLMPYLPENGKWSLRIVIDAAIAAVAEKRGKK